MLVVDQLRIERRAGGIFDCNATGCYDRILPLLAPVHLRNLELPNKISTFLARIMLHTRRHVKTKYWISKQSIKTTEKQPLYWQWKQEGEPCCVKWPSVCNEWWCELWSGGWGQQHWLPWGRYKSRLGQVGTEVWETKLRLQESSSWENLVVPDPRRRLKTLSARSRSWN